MDPGQTAVSPVGLASNPRAFRKWTGDLFRYSRRRCAGCGGRRAVGCGVDATSGVALTSLCEWCGHVWVRGGYEALGQMPRIRPGSLGR